MKVLVTGAAGTIGRRVTFALSARGHDVRALDVGSLKNHLRARRMRRQIEWVWGDVRSRTAVDDAVAGVDGIIHLAAVLPPRAYEAPVAATSVNLDGARTVIEATTAMRRPVVFIYTSSAAVYGVTRSQQPPVRPDQPVFATDEYTGAKLRGEEMLRNARFSWVILRLSHVPMLAMRMPHRVMFEIPLDNRMELLHVDDAASAIVNALESENCRSRTLLIGGGPTCQVLYKDYLEQALSAMGLAMPPGRAFSTHYHYSDWLDTAESERQLHYQRHSFGDIMRSVEREARRLRPLVRALTPVLSPALTRLSPYV